MRRFTRLYLELDASNKTGDKHAALVRYFREAPPADAAWALFFLTGRRFKRAVTGRVLREAIRVETGYPDWMLEACYEAVGDLSETIALLVHRDGSHRQDAGATEMSDPPLHELVEERIAPLVTADDARRVAIIRATWAVLDEPQRLVFHKLISGTYRVGVQRRLVARALAEAADVEPALMAHRLAGTIEPTAAAYRNLMAGSDVAHEPGRPYPFFLAHPLDLPVESLGDPRDWQVEWKWDGIRAQLIRRGGDVLLWSRGDELITTQFPEIAGAARRLPDGLVLDGEVLAWRGNRPLPFAALQKRLGRRMGSTVQMDLFSADTVAFVAYDLLELDGDDQRALPMRKRRARLERIFENVGSPHLRLSPIVPAASWADVAAVRETAREDVGAEGMMLKHRESPYGVGRTKVEAADGATAGWWKWKVDPFSVDAVLVYAQHGHGRRAGLYTDYTFGVWDDRDGRRELVPFAKAYSGLTNEEIEEVDRFVRANTIGRKGPVREVRPELVFELAFEGIQESTRHRSGVAVRFPRMVRWRRDKSVAEADTLEALHGLLRVDQG